MLGLRANEGDAVLGQNVGEARVLGQEPVAGVDRLRAGADEPFTRYYVAIAWALQGEKERALEMLERAAAMRRAYTVARARIEPDFGSLRDEPRFRKLLGSSQPE